jgi:mRNA-degrading endonuclease RelE of RelBE toxin-antitoxin system
MSQNSRQLRKLDKPLIKATRDKISALIQHNKDFSVARISPDATTLGTNKYFDRAWPSLLRQCHKIRGNCVSLTSQFVEDYKPLIKATRDKISALIQHNKDFSVARISPDATTSLRLLSVKNIYSQSYPKGTDVETHRSTSMMTMAKPPEIRSAPSFNTTRIFRWQESLQMLQLFVFNKLSPDEQR